MQPVTLAGTKLGYIHVRGFPAAASFRILLIGGTEQLTVSCLLSGRLLRGQHTEDVELDRQSRLRREPSFQLSALWAVLFRDNSSLASLFASSNLFSAVRLCRPSHFP